MHLARGQFFLDQTIQLVVRAELAQASFFWDQENFAFCESSSHHSNGWVPTSSAEVFFQETPARYRTLAVCQNEYLPQVSGWVEGCWVQEKAAVSPAAYSVCTCGWHYHAQGRTPDLQDQASRRFHLSMPIYSRGNNEEYLLHIIAVLQVIKQKGLPRKCRVLAKAVVKRSEALKNLQEAAGSFETPSQQA